VRALVQRVSEASVEVEGRVTGAIGTGLLVLLGVADGDGPKDADRLAEKVVRLRCFNDAQGAISLIDSDPEGYPDRSWADRSRDTWQQLYAAKRAELARELGKLSVRDLAPTEARAVHLMRAAVAESTASPDSLAPVGHCQDAGQARLALQPLQQALYACFAELGNNLEFEHAKVTRVAAFELLTRLEEPERRKALFMAFVPLWQALNGADEVHSPYRRMVRMAAADAQTKASPVDAAARNNVWLAYPMNPAPGQYWVLLVWLALGVAGVFVQLAVTAKGKK